MRVNYYSVLAIDRKASKKEIKDAYKKLAMQYHPDRNNGTKESEEQFKRINEAYTVLSDPAKKLIYDQQLDFASYQQYTRYTPETAKYTKHYSPKHQSAVNLEQLKNDYNERNKVNGAKSGWSNVLFMGTVFLVFITATILYFSMAKQLNAVNYYDNAVLLLKDKDYTASLKELDKALEKNKKFSEAYYLRAEIRYILKQDLNLAVSDYTQAFTYKPKLINDSTLLHRALCYYNLQEFNNALADLDKALKLNPTYDSLIYYRGATYAQLFKYKEALEIFNNLADFSPQFEKTYSARAFCLSHLGRHKEVLPDLNRAITADSTNHTYLLLRGNTYFELNQTQEACKDWSKALLYGAKAADQMLQKHCLTDSLPLTLPNK